MLIACHPLASSFQQEFFLHRENERVTTVFPIRNTSLGFLLGSLRFLDFFLQFLNLHLYIISSLLVFSSHLFSLPGSVYIAYTTFCFALFWTHFLPFLKIAVAIWQISLQRNMDHRNVCSFQIWSILILSAIYLSSAKLGGNVTEAQGRVEL